MKDVESEVGESKVMRPTSAVVISSASRGEKIAKIGTLVSAVMASSCCWLPLLLLAVGVSGVGIASTLEAHRPAFAVVTFAFLAAAFYFTYRPRRAIAEGEHDCCAPQQTKGMEDCCSTSGERRFSMVALNKVMLWAVTVMAIGFLSFPNYVGALLGGDGKTVTDNMNQAVINVEGMTCEGCSAIVAKAIRSVPGVLAVEVDYDKAQAVVGTDIGYPIPEDKIQSVLQQAGYNGEFVDSN